MREEKKFFSILNLKARSLFFAPIARLNFLSGANDPIEVKYWIRPEDRKAAISVWAVSGEFDLFVDGRSVWEGMT